MAAISANKPRLSVLTHPCLQCQLKGMKCDSKAPSCSRCLRMGELCLFQARGNGEDCSVQLRRFNGETTPDFQKKMELQARLLEEVREDRERQNWILPIPIWERKRESPQGK